MFNESLEAPTLVEDYRGDPKSPHIAKIRGRFLRPGAISSNGRVYSDIKTPLERAQAKIAAGGVLDMRVYHETNNSLDVVGRLTKVDSDGTYEGLVANTASGKDVLNLIEGEYLKHVSLRAHGAKTAPVTEDHELYSRGVRENVMDFNLDGVDYTNQPGIAEASVSLAESAGAGNLVESFEVVDLPYWERDFSADRRKSAAKEGAALPDGAFPIYNQEDLNNAWKLRGHNKNHSESSIVAHIRKRAKALGLKMPDSGNESDNQETNMADKTFTEAFNEVLEAAPGMPVVVDPDEAEIAKQPTRGPIAEMTREVVEGLKDIREGKEPVAAEQTIDEDESAEEAEAPLEETEGAVETAEEAPEVDEAAAITVVEALNAAALALQEAGAVMSAASKSKLKPAHDVIAEMAGLPCVPDTDNDGESAQPQQVLTENVLEATVERAVKAALAEQAKEFDGKIDEAVQQTADEFRKSRRKSHAVLEHKTAEEEAENEVEQMKKTGDFTPALRAILAANSNLSR